MAAADTRTLTEYLLEQEDDGLEEILLQYMADEQDLREQEQLNRTHPDLSTLSVKQILTGGTLTSEAEGMLADKAGSMLAPEARGALDDEAESHKTDSDTADMVKCFTAKTNNKLQVYR